MIKSKLKFTRSFMQAVGYEFDNDEYHRYVHGRLPYENLKPDPVLRSLLLGLPLRKLVLYIRFIFFLRFGLASVFILTVFYC